MKSRNKELYILGLSIILFIGIYIWILLCGVYSIGYFIKGPDMNVEHSYRASILELDDGNILVLGENEPDSSIPSEIYDIKSNKFKYYDLIKDSLYYLPEGVLLDNNKLLLLYVNDPHTKYKKEDNANFYNSMAIVDLNSGKVEKYVSKKINQKYKLNNYTKYAKLGNGNIIIVDFSNKVAEIYNPTTNSSKLINLKYEIAPYAEMVPIMENKLLIFGGYLENNYIKNNDVVEYKDNEVEIISVGNALPRQCSIISKISDNKIIIAGGVSRIMQGFYTQEIELYDISTNESDIIGKFTEHRQTREMYFPSYSGVKLSDRYYITAGGNRAYGSFGSDSNSTDIIDLKNNVVKRGPKMIYRTSDFKMIKLINGDVLCISTGFSPDIPYRQRTQILKTWRFKL